MISEEEPAPPHDSWLRETALNETVKLFSALPPEDPISPEFVVGFAEVIATWLKEGLTNE